MRNDVNALASATVRTDRPRLGPSHTNRRDSPYEPSCRTSWAPKPAWLERGRLPGLDGLRGISIILVLLDHVALTAGFPLPSVGFARPGHFGVSIFFAISGFLITTLLVREWQRSATVSLSQFYWRRALRILPAYLTFLFAVWMLSHAGTIAVSPLEWAATLTYTVNFLTEPSWVVGHIWSLSVEEQFYLVWPLLLLRLSPGGARRAVITYLIGAPLVRIGILVFLPDRLELIEQLTPLRLDAIAAGCLLALLAWDERVRGWLTEVSKNRTPWFAAAGLAASFILSEWVSAYGVTLAYSFEAACIVALIWFVVTRSESAFGRLLETRPLVLLGVLSYSLYLWQQLFLNPHAATALTSFPLNVVLGLGAAAVSYHVIELPFLRIKDRKALVGAPLESDVRPAAQRVEAV